MRIIFIILTSIIFIGCNSKKNDNPVIEINTAFGNLEIELYANQAPKTVAAFLHNIEIGIYKKSNFYRVLKNEDLTPQTNYGIIQAGIYPLAKSTDSIPLETTNITGLSHVSGTISMARGTGENATTEFFICIGEQKTLDFGGDLPEDKKGFAAFGKVITGMDVVRQIQNEQSIGDKFINAIEISSIEKQ